MSEDNSGLMIDYRKSFADDAYSSPSDELAATKSGPDVRLTILGEKLNIAETRCDSLKSKLDYMKILFHGVPTETAEFLENALPTTDKFGCDDASIKTVSYSGSPVCKPNTDDHASSENMKYHLFRKEIQKIQRATKEEDLSVTQSQGNISDAKFANVPFETEKQSTTNDIMKTIVYDDSTATQPCPEATGSTECITVPSTKKVKKKREMILNMNENTNASHALTCKNLSKGERKYRSDYAESTKKKPSASTVGESIMSKSRRKRGRLRSVSSKSTLTAKDTSVLGKKELKRRKYKGCVTSLSQDRVSLSSPRRNRSEVVEIYHNVAVKSDSISAVSSKHSKYDPYVKFAERRFTELANNKTGRISPLQDLTEDPRDEQESNQESLKNEQDPKATAGSVQKQEEHHVMFHENYDPLATRNYETPTLASRLKRSNRSYLNRFNFRNIPFVVGTSVTPSHNLGLNIQQVLSIMKMRQPTVNSVAPLLIRKVSRGMQPVSILMEHMSHQCEGMCDKNMRMARNAIEASEHERLKIASAAQIRYYEGEAASKERSNIEDRPRTTLTQNSSSPKGIRDVLLDLHDQFEKMNAKYEKMQTQTERCADESLQTEMSILEKDLNAKEKEINAVIGLYKEVITLKRQIKRLQDKNSLVCIATKSPVMQSDAVLPMAVPVQNRLTKSLQTFSLRRERNASATKEPSTSIRLASLLRQIQLYQKQLKLAA